MTKIGRPRKPVPSRLKGFLISDALIDKLETYPNQSKIVNDALTNFFNLQLSSDKWITEQIQEYEMKLATLHKQLDDRRIKQENEGKANEQLQKDFEKFCKAIRTVFSWNTKEFNKMNNCRITDYNHYKEIRTKVEKNEFTIDDYKNIRGEK